MKINWSAVLQQVLAALIVALLLSGIAIVWAQARGFAVQVLTDVPPHTVVAYDDPGGCPDGWSDFEASSGRFIVGVGDGYGYRSMGGADSVQLLIEDMPVHNHAIDPSEWGYDVEGVGESLRINRDDGPPYNRTVGNLTTASVGGSRFHENRPPYLALHLCRKD